MIEVLVFSQLLPEVDVCFFLILCFIRGKDFKETKYDSRIGRNTGIVLPSVDNDIRISLEGCGVKKEIVNLLLSVFPSASFKQYYPLFIEAMEKPASLRNTITEFEIQLGLGVTSHIAIVVRELLGLSNFSLFTRDYVKRCGDLVEYFVKTRILEKLPCSKLNKSLGNIIHTLRKRYNNKIPLELLNTLKLFDVLVYRPAKHKFDNLGRPLFGVQDAIAVTFISIRLCQLIEQAGKNL